MISETFLISFSIKLKREKIKFLLSKKLNLKVKKLLIDPVTKMHRNGK